MRGMLSWTRFAAAEQQQLRPEKTTENTYAMTSNRNTLTWQKVEFPIKNLFNDVDNIFNHKVIVGYIWTLQS